MFDAGQRVSLSENAKMLRTEPMQKKKGTVMEWEITKLPNRVPVQWDGMEKIWHENAIDLVKA